MDNFTYLNQISQSARAKASPKPKKDLFNFSLGKIILGGLVIFFILMVFGGLLGSINGKPKDLAKQVYARSTSLSETITNFTPYVKSSRLRSIGVSLSTILNHSGSQLATYIGGEDQDEKDFKLSKKIEEQETQNSESLNISLTNAKLNGILDRAYENQITLQVSLLLSQISELLARTKDENLITILTTYQSNLQTIHNNLEAYSSHSN